MKKIILFFILGVLFTSGCKQICDSELYTSDGKCCNFVCDKDCVNGYKEGTCNCECNEVLTENEGTKDTNIDEIFDESAEIEPPSIPT